MKILLAVLAVLAVVGSAPMLRGRLETDSPVAEVSDTPATTSAVSQDATDESRPIFNDLVEITDQQPDRPTLFAQALPEFVPTEESLTNFSATDEGEIVPNLSSIGEMTDPGGEASGNFDDLHSDPVQLVRPNNKRSSSTDPYSPFALPAELSADHPSFKEPNQRSTDKLEFDSELYLEKIVAFKLDKLSAESAATFLNEQFDSFTFSAEPRANIVFARIPDAAHREIEVFLKSLEQLPSAAAANLTDAQEPEEWSQFNDDFEGKAYEFGGGEQVDYETIVFRVRYVDPQHIRSILQQLGYGIPGDGQDPHSPFVAASTAGLIIRGSKDQVEEVQRIVESLDAPPQGASQRVNPDPFQQSIMPPVQPNEQQRPMSGFPQFPSELSVPSSRPDTFAQPNNPLGTSGGSTIPNDNFRPAPRQQFEMGTSPQADQSGVQAFQSLERDIAAARQVEQKLAAELRTKYRLKLDPTRALTPEQNQEFQELENKLARHVAELFELRMKLQRAKLDRVQSDLDAARTKLDQRERVKETIIDRRVDDLISGDVFSWDSASSPQPMAPYSLVPGAVQPEMKPMPLLYPSDIQAEPEPFGGMRSSS